MLNVLSSRWRDPNFPLADEDAFETIKAGVDAMPAGVKMMLNSGLFTGLCVISKLSPLTFLSHSGQFYGPNRSTANLELLGRFFEKYPSYADKAFLSVKVRHSHQAIMFHLTQSYPLLFRDPLVHTVYMLRE